MPCFFATICLQVILSGGTCKIPRLQKLISETFSSAQVLSSIPPDEVLAYGAAIEASAVTGSYGATNGNAIATNGGSSGDKNASQKKKKVVDRKKDVMRTHLPVMVSALSVSVWAKVRKRIGLSVDPSVVDWLM